jgi:agmatinase
MRRSMPDSRYVTFPPRGVLSFAAAPFTTPGDPAGADVIVLGVPWDGGTGLRGGARHGPRAIREASLRFPLWERGRPCGYWDVASGRDRLVGVSVVDGGDVATVRASQKLTDAAITEAARAARQSGGLPLTLGGDHSLTYPVLRAFDDLGEIAIVQLDAHLDFSDEAGGVRFNSSTALRRSSELPHVGSITTIGLRGTRTSRAAYESARERGNVLVSREDLRRDGIAAAIERVPSSERVYLTLDIDVLDATIAPGVSAPELDGISSGDLRALVQGIAARTTIVGMDIVEVSPTHDPAGTTALAAAQIAVEALAAIFG